MPSDQTTNLFRTGVVNPIFDAEKPFSIGIGSAGGIGGGSLSISSPASYTNGTTPVSFSISTPSGHYFAVEVATDASLFNSAANGGQRAGRNFYASWKAMPFRQGTSFTLPRDWWTESPIQWVGHGCTTPNNSGQSAPSFAISREFDMQAFSQSGK